MTVIAVIGLLLFVLTLIGVNENLAFRRQFRADRGRCRTGFRGLNDHVATGRRCIIDFIGVVVRRAAYPDCRVVGGQGRHDDPEGRRHHNVARPVRTIPGTPAIIIINASIKNYTAAPRRAMVI
jgi:hypothetical protein